MRSADVRGLELDLKAPAYGGLWRDRWSEFDDGALAHEER